MTKHTTSLQHVQSALRTSRLQLFFSKTSGGDAHSDCSIDMSRRATRSPWASGEDYSDDPAGDVALTDLDSSHRGSTTLAERTPGRHSRSTSRLSSGTKHINNSQPVAPDKQAQAPLESLAMRVAILEDEMARSGTGGCRIRAENGQSHFIGGLVVAVLTALVAILILALSLRKEGAVYETQPVVSGECQLGQLRATVLAELKAYVDQEIQACQASPNGSQGLTKLHLEQVVADALFAYSSDKTNLTDWAFRGTGGHVVKHSNTYLMKAKSDSVVGWFRDVLHPAKTPEEILSSDMSPGACWALQGSVGFSYIRLRAPIFATHVGIEHIAASLSPNPETAPKRVRFWGIHSRGQRLPNVAGSGGDDVGVLLADVEYDVNGPLVQTFSVEAEAATVQISHVRADFLTNYGSAHYTCVYRVRIHGVPSVASSPLASGSAASASRPRRAPSPNPVPLTDKGHVTSSGGSQPTNASPKVRRGRSQQQGRNPASNAGIPT